MNDYRKMEIGFGYIVHGAMELGRGNLLVYDMIAGKNEAMNTNLYLLKHV